MRLRRGELEKEEEEEEEEEEGIIMMISFASKDFQDLLKQTGSSLIFIFHNFLTFLYFVL